MASVFKPKGSTRYVINYTDESGKRRKKTAYTDKRESERLASSLEEHARKTHDGLTDRHQDSVKKHVRQPILDHIDAYHDFLIAADKTGKFADLARRRLRNLFESMGTKTLLDIDLEKTQAALASFREDGRSLKTLNHYGDTAKMFLAWCRKTSRLARDPLADLERYKEKTDPRRERRSITVGEFARLLESAESGPRFGRMIGPTRSLCYRLTLTCGLRYDETKAMRAAWLDFDAMTLTIPAKFTKNRKKPTLPLDSALAKDLGRHVATLQPGAPVFPMPKRASEMIRADLERVGIPYKDAQGKVFDFHSLRVMTATLHDEAGTPSGVRRELMRHSTDSMTAHYTKPRHDSHRDAVSRVAEMIAGAKSATQHATDAPNGVEQNGVNHDASASCANGTDSLDAGAIPAASTAYVN